MSFGFVLWIVTTQCANFAFYLMVTCGAHGWWRAIAAYIAGYLVPLAMSLLWVNPQLHGGSHGSAGSLALGFPLFFAVWSVVTMSMSRGTFGHRLFAVLVCGVHQIGAFVFSLLALNRLSTLAGGILAVVIMAGMCVFLLTRAIPRVIRMDNAADWRALNLTAVMSLVLLFVTGYYPTYVPTGSGASIAIFVVAYVVSVVYFPVARAFAEQNRTERALRIARDNTRVMLAELKTMRVAEEGARRVRHDMRHHVSVVREMLGAGRMREADDYLANLGRHELLSSLGAVRRCANPLIDTLLAVADRKASVCGKTVQAEVDVSETLPFDEVDIVTVLGNLIENAIRNGAGDVISVLITLERGVLRVKVANAVEPGFVLTNGLPAATEGVGLLSVRRVVEKHHGLMGFELKDCELTCKVVIGCV